MKKLLLTGFEVFGDYAENITEVAATQIKILGEYEVHGLVFPVSIFPENGEDYGETILAYAREIHADAIISLGMAPKAKGIILETRAINWVENNKYCVDSEQRRVLDETLILKKELKVDLVPWHLNRLWNLATLFEKFHSRNIHCDINYPDNIGTFHSNALRFRTLNAIEKQKTEIPYLFLNVPCSFRAIQKLPDSGSYSNLMSLGRLKKILEATLENL